jgi:hypothetical protein
MNYYALAVIVLGIVLAILLVLFMKAKDSPI